MALKQIQYTSEQIFGKAFKDIVLTVGLVWVSGVLLVALVGQVSTPIALVFAVFWASIYFNRPWVLFAAFLSLTFYSQLFQGNVLGFTFYQSWADTSLNKMGNFLGYFTLIITLIKGNFARFRWLKIDTLLAFFVLTMFFSGLLSDDLGPTLDMFTRIPQYISLYVLARVYLNDEEAIGKFIKLFLFHGIIITGVLTWQLIVGQLQQDIGRPHLARQIIPFYLGLAFIVNFKPRKYLILSGLLSFLALFAFSRRVFLTIIAYWFLFVAQGRHKVRTFLISAVALILLWNAVPDSLRLRINAAITGGTDLITGDKELKEVDAIAMSGRQAYWIPGWNMFTENPLIGVGTMNSPNLYPEYGGSYVALGARMHNYFLRILAEQGLIGFGLFIFIYITIFRYATKAAKRFSAYSNNYFKMFVIAEYYYILAFLLVAFFGAWGLYDNEQWFVFGIIVALYEFTERKAFSSNNQVNNG